MFRNFMVVYQKVFVVHWKIWGLNLLEENIQVYGYLFKCQKCNLALPKNC